MNANHGSVINAGALANFASASAVSSTGVKNGVKAPGPNDANRRLWDDLDALVGMGAIPSLTTAKRLAKVYGRSEAAVIVAYHQWARFNEDVIG